MPVTGACQDAHSEAQQEELGMSRTQRWIYAGMAAVFLVWGLVAGSRGSWLGWLLAGCALAMGASLLMIRVESRQRTRQDPPTGSTS